MPPEARERLLVLLDALASTEPELPVPNLWDYVREYRAQGEDLARTQTDVLLLLRILTGTDLVEKRVPGGYRLSVKGQREASEVSKQRPETAERAKRAVRAVAVGA